MEKIISVFIVMACSINVQGQLKDLDANTIHDLPEPTALDVIGANRGRVATDTDRKRVAEAEAAAKAAAKKAADDAEAAAKAAAKKAADDAKKGSTPPPPAP